MKLQLVDGFMERPLGLLEKVVVTSCGIEYEHIFAMVNFGKEPNYEIILGRPFMNQMKMIQDWGYIYIYLCHPSATTRIDLRDHSYKDVLNTLVKDMVSTIRQEESVPSWVVLKEPFWLCGMDEEEEGLEVSGKVEYISKPFPEHELEPYGWHGILATLDVCANVHEGAIYYDE